ncbi:uncharacterized protein [Dysidea avara]|uniref:uncharacterized protein n=1 Tax=Dysidea avara TaxID=196820 RepID=UPI0033234404
MVKPGFDQVLFVLLLTVDVLQSNAQNTTESNVTLEDCRYFPDEAESCISDYETLEELLRADDEQIATLARNFYRTGQDPTEYIKITYMFQITSSDEDETCVPIERNYIWSTSPVFLLGPKALFWLSLFSISVNEESVTIRLPCIQETAQRDLLTRLTYLSRMYAQGRYVEELDLDLASKYYFQTQSNSDEDVHYRTIYAILFYLEVLSSLLYTFLCLTTYTWIFPAFVKSKQDLKETISPKFIKLATLYKLKEPHYIAKFITAIIALVLMIIFHIFAAVKLFKHREEVFNEDVPPSSIVALLFTFGVTMLYLVIFCIVYCYKGEQFDLKKYIMHCLTSLSIAYFGHFVPFVSLAFMQDPLKTFLVVAGELLVVICVYGVVLVAVYTISYQSYRVSLDALGWVFSAVIVITTLTTVLMLFSLGSFNDFVDIQELLFPLIGTVGTLLLGYCLKPSGEEEGNENATQQQETPIQPADANTVTASDEAAGEEKGNESATQQQETSIQPADANTLTVNDEADSNV